MKRNVDLASYWYGLENELVTKGKPEILTEDAAIIEMVKPAPKAEPEPTGPAPGECSAGGCLLKNHQEVH